MLFYGLVGARESRKSTAAQAGHQPGAAIFGNKQNIQAETASKPAPPTAPGHSPTNGADDTGGKRLTALSVVKPPLDHPGDESKRDLPKPVEGRLVALNLRPSAELGTVEVSSLAAVDEGKTTTSLHCERFYFAAGKGICLSREIQFVSARTVATIVDEKFRPLSSVRIDGIPTRARISPDGRYGAFTVFVLGHSYAAANLSTATLLLDMGTGSTIANLEEFKVFQNGKLIQSPDFNYWGVTFQHDSNFFYATLRTGGVNYLVHGDIKAATVTITYKGVECPSLSPDETRIAFKKMISRGKWRLTVLNLATFEEISLAETGSVDDQPEWLDNGHVLYGMAPATMPPFMNIMVVPADGSGHSRVFAKGASSPAVVR